MSQPNQAQFEFWEERAPSWLDTNHAAKIAGRFGPHAVERLGLQPGGRVLDIGCGSGETTRALAALVDPDGQAVGADLSPTMIAAAKERAVAAGVDNIVFVAADAQTEDLGRANFDAAFSQFGVMFFADPVVAFTNIRGALRPGAPLAFVCWQNIFENEWMFIPGAAVVSVTGELPPMPGPGEPGPFSLSEPERITEILTAAGFSAITIDPVTDTVVAPTSEVDAFVASSVRMGSAREALRTVDQATGDRILAAIRQALLDAATDDEIRLKASVFVVSATA